MIPISPFNFLLILGIPAAGVLITVWLIYQFVNYWKENKQISKSFFSKKICLSLIFAISSGLFGIYLLLSMMAFSKDYLIQQYYKESRSHFILAHDSQYGELLIPKGSLIDRYDSFDNGNPNEPFSLRGLKAVRFPYPVKVAGLWVIAMKTYPGELELAKEQKIGPVTVYEEDNPITDYKNWVPQQKTYSSIICPSGGILSMEVPPIEYDIEKEFGKPEPDGRNARFRPSEWTVKSKCQIGGFIEIDPQYTGELPKKSFFLKLVS